MKQAAWGLLALVAAISLAAPLLAPHDPQQIHLENNLASPSGQHFLGTDLLGRDVFSRLLYGGRQSLSMALGATFIAAAVGLGVGIAARSGHGGMMLILLDTLLAFPSLLIALVVISLLGNGFFSIMIAVGVAGIGAFGRTAHDALAATERMPYVESAISLGASRFHILRRHLLPNARPTLLAFLGVTFGWSLLNGAALSFLGFLGDPNAPDWGMMLAAGRQTFAAAPYEALSAGVMVTLTVAAVNRLCR